jgi:hypothetical protein
LIVGTTSTTMLLIDLACILMIVVFVIIITTMRIKNYRVRSRKTNTKKKNFRKIDAIQKLYALDDSQKPLESDGKNRA